MRVNAWGASWQPYAHGYIVVVGGHGLVLLFCCGIRLTPGYPKLYTCLVNLALLILMACHCSRQVGLLYQLAMLFTFNHPCRALPWSPKMLPMAGGTDGYQLCILVFRVMVDVRCLEVDRP
jgi:hypothetical protein